VTKTELRDLIRRRLAALSPDRRAEASARIEQTVIDLPAWRAARVVMCFLSLPAEVQTAGLIRHAWSAGKRVLVPRVDWDRRVMSAAPLNSLETVIVGRYGLSEPPPAPPADPATIDLLLVPGLAFDADGYRLGRGGGYYDRFLSQLRGQPGFRGLACGLAFDCQTWASPLQPRFARVPREPHDVPVDLLVTESGVTRFPTPPPAQKP